MASWTITLTDQCAGGEHLTLEVAGSNAGTFNLARSEITDDLPSADQVLRFLIKQYARGKTANQVRTALLAGLTITIG